MRSEVETCPISGTIKRGKNALEAGSQGLCGLGIPLTREGSFMNGVQQGYKEGHCEGLVYGS